MVERQLSAQPPLSVASGDVVVEVGPTDAEGRLEAPAAGQVVLSLLSPEALEREAGECAASSGGPAPVSNPL